MGFSFFFKPIPTQFLKIKKEKVLQCFCFLCVDKYLWQWHKDNEVKTCKGETFNIDVLTNYNGHCKKLFKGAQLWEFNCF